MHWRCCCRLCKTRYDPQERDLRPTTRRALCKHGLYFLKTLVGSEFPRIFVLYDIACQWSKKLHERLEDYPLLLRPDSKTCLTFAIPKAHIKGHGPSYQNRFSLNCIPGSARTDGEGVERDWAHLNALASSTKEMGGGNREETLDDHLGAWNWQKTVNLGT